MEEALNMLKMVIDIHQRGGFMMSNWMSNSQKLLKELLGEYILCKRNNINLHYKNFDRVLGLCWNTQDNNFELTLRFDKVSEDILKIKEVSMKRDILKVVMIIFDPLGCWSPYWSF